MALSGVYHSPYVLKYFFNSGTERRSTFLKKTLQNNILILAILNMLFCSYIYDN